MSALPFNTEQAQHQETKVRAEKEEKASAALKMVLNNHLRSSAALNSCEGAIAHAQQKESEVEEEGCVCVFVFFCVWLGVSG